MPAAWRNISVAITTDVSKYKAGLDQASTATKTFGSEAQRGADKAGKAISGAGAQATKTGGIWSRATGGMSSGAMAMSTAVGFSVAQVASKLVGLGVNAVQSAAQFQTSMLNVQSLGEESTASIAHLSAAVLDMSTTLPQSANILAEGLYDIESSGFSGAQAIDVLHASASAASAGLTDTATSARAITAVLNSYGLAGADASKVSDILFQTVNVGVVSFEELAQSIGNFVPMAAAMGISLDQASGALATMTLAGLPAAEAATSLSRVMESFIKPSEEMGATMARLGITLDDLADPAFGLSGAMRAIAKDTHGSTVALQALFPDVRSLRGALALVANDGKTYDRVMRSYTKATEGAGATSRALAEQMKGLSAQWKVFQNRLSAASTGAMLSIFPLIQDGARQLGDILADLGNKLAPAWRDLQSAGGDLVDVFKDLWAGVQPVAKLVAVAFGATAVGLISAFAAGLSTVAHLLAANAGLVKTVGTAIAVWFVASKIIAVGSALVFVLNTLRSIAATRGVSTTAAAVQALGLSAGGAAGGVAALRASLATLGPALIVAVSIMGVVNAIDAVRGATKKAKAEIGKNNAQAAGKGIDGLRVAYDKAAKSTQDFSGTIHDGQSVLGAMGRTLQGAAQNALPFFKNSVSDATAKLRENQKEAAKLAEKLPVMSKHYDRLGYNLGLTRGQVDALVRSDKKLNLATASTADVTKSVTGTLNKLSAATGFAKGKVASLLEAMSPDQLEEFTSEMNKAGDAVGGAIAKFGDLTSIKGLQFNDDLSVTPQQLQWNIGAIKSFYEKRLAGAKQFSADMTTAITQGYDPALVMKLAQAGPDQAGPILRSLVAGYSGQMVELVNSANRELDRIASAAAEKARAMYMATTMRTDDLTKLLPDYQRIVDMAAAGMKSPEIALRLKMSAAEFDKVLEAFGNQSLPKLQAVADKKGPKVPVRLAIPKQFDRNLLMIEQRIGSIADITAAPKISLDLTNLLGDKKLADAELDDLSRTRKALIEADAPQAEIAQVDAKMALVAATRTAIVNAHGDPTAIDTTAFQLDYLSRLRMSMIASDADPAAIAGVEAKMRNLIRRRTADIVARPDTAWAEAQLDAVMKKTRTAVITALITPGANGEWQSTPGQWAKGGIQKYAKGGLSAMAAGGITNRQIIKFGEPETGGEAYIPRLGITSVRAKKILDVAAGWHGLTVGNRPGTPVAQSWGQGGGGDHSTRVIFEAGAIQADGMDASTAGDMIAQRMQFRLAGAGGSR